MPRLTSKEKYNRKHKQSLSTPNSKAEIARLSKISYASANRLMLSGERAFRNSPTSHKHRGIKSAVQNGYSRLYRAVLGDEGDRAEIIRGRREFYLSK